MRSSWLTLLITALIAILLGWQDCLRANPNWSKLAAAGGLPPDPVYRSLGGLIFAQLAMGVLGVLAITSEYATGMIRTTFTAVPQRCGVFCAKLLALGAVTLVAGEIVCFTAFFVGQAALGTHGVTLGHHGALRAVLGGGYCLLAVALIGLGLGTLLRHTAGALTTLFLLLLVSDPIIRSQLNETADAKYIKYLPLQAMNRITSLHGAPPHPVAQSVTSAFVVLTVYVAVPLCAGALRFTRRDP